ncbi:vacuolar sorting protein 9 (VPS9) domain-containing protein [Hirsutella rhossiliensis]|uniref:Vacuolar sorting protein 9 (VPS9) domain-containing protein n=1 Tax=Hirsutella rhossiliensis TaxID=111463 RepID=A0A9P8N366_9HYPO|nr:vacuolar sorting protein 9 (VPS9) domain-containing protein [Hirsutella rhossiliensis]KAH0966823.1 vacuolar sorting protein 9 (VPS9) domain-containing protein [Hirsutella rhossiliensis]
MISCPPAQQPMASQNSQGFRPPRQPATRMPSYPQVSVRDENDCLKPPKRAHTFHNGSPTQKHREQSRLHPIDNTGPDAFETAEPTDNDDAHDMTRASVDLDDLPIELITLTDSFIESLAARVHPTPPNIDRLSQLFQEFYALASSHVGTHIGALASRQSRDASPTPSGTTISSAASRLRSKAASFGTKEKSKTEAEQQMITADELANRKRARKALEAKRGLLEEAVERRLCEGIYGRIYRHRSTQDEALDDKLRSKTAALALVGIGLADLGVETGEGAPSTPEHAADKERDVREWLGQARADLTRMGESRYPLGKLNNLKAAHKSIVNTLAHFHPSASADEIMPMLIYTLITMPPEKLHIMSDLHFIQQFRWEPKLTGEAAYCLTNLEAAISFLQTVDLATLREDEHPSGQPKSATQPGTPRAETFPPAYPQGPLDVTTPTKDAAEANPNNASATKSAPPPSALKTSNVLKNRRLSELVNTPAQAFGAASDAVFSTADQGLKTISSSLGDSYSFLLGKLRDSQQSTQSSSIVVPRTLDDARKLVSTPPPDEDDSASGANSAVGAEDAEQMKRSPVREDKVANMIGRRREPSVESAKSGRSASSNKKVLFAEESKSSTSFLSSSQSPAVLEQVRSLGSSFNPMARLSNIGMIRGFGRNTPTPTAAASPKDIGKTSDGGDLASAFPDIADALPPKEGLKVAPPNKRFMEVQDPGELRLSEVQDLLGEYRRMAEALKSLGAFEDS